MLYTRHLALGHTHMASKSDLGKRAGAAKCRECFAVQSAAGLCLASCLSSCLVVNDVAAQLMVVGVVGVPTCGQVSHVGCPFDLRSSFK